MRQVRFKLLPAAGAGVGSWQRAPLSQFLLSIPAVAFAVKAFHAVPPREPLNDLLQLGVHDAGMSGGCEWPPFHISLDEYDEVVEEWLTDSALNAKVSVVASPSHSWQEWEEILVREHQERRRDS
jgi:hypothetical protein